MIVKFLKSLKTDDKFASGTLYFAITNSQVRQNIGGSIVISALDDLKDLPQYQEITCVDFLDTDMVSVEVLVDALLLSDILKREVMYHQDSVLFTLVNECLGCLSVSFED